MAEHEPSLPWTSGWWVAVLLGGGFLQVRRYMLRYTLGISSLQKKWPPGGKWLSDVAVYPGGIRGSQHSGFQGNWSEEVARTSQLGRPRRAARRAFFMHLFICSLPAPDVAQDGRTETKIALDVRMVGVRSARGRLFAGAAALVALTYKDMI